MSNKKLSEIEQKKKALEQELADIQSGLDRSIDDVREGVSSNLDPKNIIKKYPIPIVGASVVVGFLLGRNRKSPSKISSGSAESTRASDSRIAKELKRVLAKKGLNLLLDYLDQKIAELKQQKKDTND